MTTNTPEASSDSPDEGLAGDAAVEAPPAEELAVQQPALGDQESAKVETGGADTGGAETTGVETTGAAEPDVNHQDHTSEPAVARTTDEPTNSEEDSVGGDTSEQATADAEGGKKKRKRRRRKRKKSDKPEETHPRRPPTPFHVGEEVFGKVTNVLDGAIMVDLSGKALAIFDRSEMEVDDLVPDVGDRFVARVHNDGGRGGLVVLTRKPLREEEMRGQVEQAAKEGTLITGLVTGAIKGGVEVDIGGLRAFAPASGMDLHPANANFSSLIGQRLDFKVLQYEGSGRDIVVTRRPMLEAEAHERRKHALGLLQEGLEITGVVRTVVEWGAFVALPDAENLEGLVHISEISHDPRARISDTVKPGDKLPVKILKIDDKGKIWLSRKALIEDPWAEAKERFKQGSRHKGKVTRLEKFGVFVQLPDEVEGLIHIADLSVERVAHPEELFQVGQELEVVVHHFDAKGKKLALHPAPPPERAAEEPQHVTRNAHVKAEVVKGDTAGVVVRLLGVTGRASRGFIPAGQTNTARGTDLRKRFKPGTVLDLKVLDIDPRRGEPRLSIRGLQEDQERQAHREYRKKLKSEAKFGTLGDLLKTKLNIQPIEGDSSK